MKKIKAILFDFGGTLDDDGRDWFERVCQIITGQATNGQCEEFKQGMRDAADEIGRMPDTAKLSMAVTVERLCGCFHARLKLYSNDNLVQWDPMEVAAQFITEAQKCLARNREVLKKLRQRFRLGVLSNNWGNAAGWCEQFGLTEYLDTVIDSTVVGAVKPDKAIFQAALDELGLPANDCAYVGDRYDCDMLGAHGAGLKPIWITNKGQHTSDKVITVNQIGTLADLLDMNWE